MSTQKANRNFGFIKWMSMSESLGMCVCSVYVRTEAGQFIFSAFTAQLRHPEWGSLHMSGNLIFLLLLLPSFQLHLILPWPTNEIKILFFLGKIIIMGIKFGRLSNRP
jgi:hypothetical protein